MHTALGPRTRALFAVIRPYSLRDEDAYSDFNVQLRPLTTQQVAIVAAVLKTLGSTSKEYLRDF
jgi:hypothetical protein